MSKFTDTELEYLLTEFDHLVSKRRLARLATVGKDGTPHVVPVGWSYNAEHDTIDIRGYDFEQTKKFRDVERSGRAEAIRGERPLIRIHTRSGSCPGGSTANSTILAPDAAGHLTPDRPAGVILCNAAALPAD